MIVNGPLSKQNCNVSTQSKSPEGRNVCYTICPSPCTLDLHIHKYTHTSCSTFNLGSFRRGNQIAKLCYKAASVLLKHLASATIFFFFFKAVGIYSTLLEMCQEANSDKFPEYETPPPPSHSDRPQIMLFQENCKTQVN